MPWEVGSRPRCDFVRFLIGVRETCIGKCRFFGACWNQGQQQYSIAFAEETRPLYSASVSKKQHAQHKECCCTHCYDAIRVHYMCCKSMAFASRYLTHEVVVSILKLNGGKDGLESSVPEVPESTRPPSCGNTCRNGTTLYVHTNGRSSRNQLGLQNVYGCFFFFFLPTFFSPSIY